MRISDWSSYVCSSYLILIRSALFKGESAKTFVETGHLTTSIQQTLIAAGPGRMRGGINIQCLLVAFLAPGVASLERRAIRSDERRVWKECVRPCRSWWSPYHEKQTNNIKRFSK